MILILFCRVESEDNMNCQLQNITLTARDGRVTTLEHAYIRGSKIRFLILPDMLKNAPMFKRVDSKSGGRGKGLGLGRGRAAALRGGRGGMFVFCVILHLFLFLAFLFFLKLKHRKEETSCTSSFIIIS